MHQLNNKRSNLDIELTEHICLRYIERFNQNLNSVTDFNERLNRAKIAIKSILQAAHYVSDDERGVLLHSPMHKCNLIIRKRRLITLYTPDKKVYAREKRNDSSQIPPYREKLKRTSYNR